ncbi:unnamed protein product, partial [Mesorhabditis spiculigera]
MQDTISAASPRMANRRNRPCFPCEWHFGFFCFGGEGTPYGVMKKRHKKYGDRCVRLATFHAHKNCSTVLLH